jgi:hypothetical protein
VVRALLPLNLCRLVARLVVVVAWESGYVFPSLIPEGVECGEFDQCIPRLVVRAWGWDQLDGDGVAADVDSGWYAAVAL